MPPVGGFVCGLQPILAHPSHAVVPQLRRQWVVPYVFFAPILAHPSHVFVPRRQPELRRRWVVSYVVCRPSWRTPSHVFMLHREPELRRQWVVSYVFLRASWRTPHTLADPSVGKTPLSPMPAFPAIHTADVVAGPTPSFHTPRDTHSCICLGPSPGYFFAKPVCGLEGMWGAQTLELLKASATT